MKIEKELLDKFDEATKAVRDSEHELLTIQEKTRQVQESLPGLEENVQKAEQEKAQAIDDFCLSKCDQKTVDLKVEAYDRATRKESSGKEILEVLAQKEIAAQEQLHRAEQGQRQIEGRIWNFVFEKISTDTRASVGKQLHRAFVVNARRANSAIWEDFLIGIIKKPQREHLDELAPEINKLFQDAIRR